MSSTRIDAKRAAQLREMQKLVKQLGVSSEKDLFVLAADKRQPLRRRNQACEALGFIASPRAEKALREVFEKSPRIRSAAWKAIECIQWKKSYFDTHQKQQQRALAIMKEFKCTSPATLTKMLLSASAPIGNKIKACLAIGYLGVAKNLPVIMKAFRSRNDRLISAAADAVINIGSRNATPSLLALIKRSNNRVARESAIYALGFLGDLRAKQLLLRIVDNQDEQTWTRAYAVEALARISDAKDVVDALIRTTRDESVFVRFTAVNALDAENPAALRALKDRLQDTGRPKDRSSIAKLAAEKIQQQKEFANYHRKLGRLIAQ